jgi:hypothetical protein
VAPQGGDNPTGCVSTPASPVLPLKGGARWAGRTRTRSMAAEVEAAGGVVLVLRVAGDLSVSEAAAGNACLCVGDCAAHDGALRTLASADAVAALVPVAQKRTGTCQRNAGIALAKMAARHDGCKTRLVELRGLEVMHAYVKP